MAEPDLLDLKPGQRVMAYNCQGSLIIGIIVNVIPSSGAPYRVAETSTGLLHIKCVHSIHPGNIFPI